MSSHTTTFPLIPTAPVGPQPVPPTGPAAPPSSLRRFFQFGNGIIRPFQRDKKGDFANSDAIKLLQSNMGQILGTRASSNSSQGELAWRPEFGSLLHQLKHRPNTAATDELARTYVIEAIQRWEPRVRITNVVVSRSFKNDGGLNTLTIKTTYNFIETATGQVIQEGLESTIVL